MLNILKKLILSLAVLLLLLTLCVKSDSSSFSEIQILHKSSLIVGNPITVTVIPTSNPAKACYLTLRNSTLVSMTKNGDQFTTNNKIDNQCDWNLATIKCLMTDGNKAEKDISLTKHRHEKLQVFMNDKTTMNLSEWRNLTFSVDGLHPRPTKISCYISTGHQTRKQLQNVTETDDIDRCGNFNITKVFTFQAEMNMLGGHFRCHHVAKDRYGVSSNYGDIPLIIWKARNVLHVKNNPSIEGMSVTVVVTSEVGSPSVEHTCTLRGKDGDKTLTGKSFGDNDEVITSTEFMFTAHEKYSEIICNIKQGNYSHFAETLRESLSVHSLRAVNKPSTSHRLIDESAKQNKDDRKQLFSLLTGLAVINIIYGVILVLLVGFFVYKKILALQSSKEKKEKNDFMN